MLAKFTQQGLSWAIIVWAAAVALMAFQTPDLVWRWSFLALSAAGLVVVVVMSWARKKLLLMAARASNDGSDS